MNYEFNGIFSGVAFISYFKQGKFDVKISLIFAGFAFLGDITATVFFIFLPIEKNKTFVN